MADESVQIEQFPRLIMGMPRAATTWMCRCLNAHPHAAAFGESSIWGRAFVAPGDGGQYDVAQRDRILNRLKSANVLKVALIDGPGGFKNITRANFPELIDSVAADHESLDPVTVHQLLTTAVAKGEGKACAIDKTPHHLMWIDRIMKHLPNARCLVMLREPYGFMLSYKHWTGQTDRSKKRFRQRYHPTACAMVWRGYMKAAAEAKRRYGDQVHLVEVRDVKSDAESVLAAVQRFFDLPVVPLADAVPAVNTSFEKQARPELTAADIFWMNQIAGRIAADAGFELKRCGFPVFSVLRSIVALVPWWFNNLGPLRRNVSGSLFAYLWNWVAPRRGGAKLSDPGSSDAV